MLRADPTCASDNLLLAAGILSPRQHAERRSAQRERGSPIPTSAARRPSARSGSGGLERWHRQRQKLERESRSGDLLHTSGRAQRKPRARPCVIARRLARLRGAALCARRLHRQGRRRHAPAHAGSRAAAPSRPARPRRGGKHNGGRAHILLLDTHQVQGSGARLVLRSGAEREAVVRVEPGRSGRASGRLRGTLLVPGWLLLRALVVARC